MVTTLSSEITLFCSSPLPGPTGTSLLSPLAVDVIGATVTLIIAARAASRVRTTTGRVLSSRARQISRTLVGDVDVAGGPVHEGVQVIDSALVVENLDVGLGSLAAHLALHRGTDQSGTASSPPLCHGPVHESHHLFG